jgi:L-rhamnose-H+ transport protein
LSSTVWLGLSLSLAAGLLSGTCMLPSKFVRGWAWENMWLVFTLVSLVIAPGVLTLLLVKNPFALYEGLGVRDYALPFLFGFGWGIAQVLFGLSIARLGMALGYAIIVGLGALLGTMVPILFQRIEVLRTWHGLLILSGVVVMVAGIALAGRAGRMREGRRAAYLPALLLAVLCGVMAPMLNFSLAFGQEIGVEAVRRGTAAANAAYAVWPVALIGGLGPNLGYCVYLLYKNKTWRRFRPVFPDLWFPVAMGVLWIGAVSVYGTSSAMLGELGTSVGWGLFQIFMIMTANASGLITGEWKQASGEARRTLGIGLGLLAVATFLMAMGNRQG